MTRAPLLLAVGLLSLSGCSSKSEVERQRDANVAAAERETPAAPLAALRRAAPLTRADREAWRKVLQWPAACEEAFQATAAAGQPAATTADGGLAFHALGTGVTLVRVTCRGAAAARGSAAGGSAIGGSQPSQVFVRLDERGSSPEAFVLRFPVVHATANASSETLSPAMEMELTGNALVAPDGRALSLLTTAQASGECGTWTLYALAGEHPRISALTVQAPCPGPVSDAPAAHDGNSPPGWRAIDIPR